MYWQFVLLTLGVVISGFGLNAEQFGDASVCTLIRVFISLVIWNPSGVTQFQWIIRFKGIRSRTRRRQNVTGHPTDMLQSGPGASRALTDY